MKKIAAFRVSGPNTNTPLRVAPRERQWMDDLDQKYGYRCLPLVMANQFGWQILSTHHVRATWNGGERLEAITIEDLKGDGPVFWSSHFGAGVLTFSMPYLFRTSPDWNLFIRGPTNSAKDGIAALDGIVETDWSHSTFTMNWKFTRPCSVEFVIGEPVCMFFPVPRNLFDEFDAEILNLTDDEEVRQNFEAWSAGRAKFNQDLKDLDDAVVKRGWQKEYFQGAQETKPRPKEFRDK